MLCWIHDTKNNSRDSPVNNSLFYLRLCSPSRWLTAQYIKWRSARRWSRRERIAPVENYNKELVHTVSYSRLFCFLQTKACFEIPVTCTVYIKPLKYNRYQTHTHTHTHTHKTYIKIRLILRTSILRIKRDHIRWQNRPSGSWKR
jgi:hypothetical protein